MTQLAQAYIHLKPYQASDRKLKALGRSTERLAIATARRIYGGGVDIIVELEEGSLRTRVTVIGTIMLGVYTAVGNYSGFKQSINELCDDAQQFAGDVCHPFLKKADASEEQIFRFERRLKTPGKLKRLSKHLERIERQAPDLSPNNLAKELAAARHELNQIAADISPEEMKLIDKAISPSTLPRPRKWPEIEQPKAAIKPNEVQGAMFDENTLIGEAPKRLVYRSRTTVPVSKAPKKSRQIENKQPLLPSSTTN